MTKIAKFFALPAEQKKLILSAAILLPIADVSLRIFGYRKTQQALTHIIGNQKKQTPPDTEQFTQAQQVAYCVRNAAQNGPYRSTCLRESLVTWWLLQRKGISTILKIGVAKENGDFKAHAWVEMSGIPIIDAESTQVTFTSIYHASLMQVKDYKL